ncbi:MAG: NPCBM/NEW2 domain-containing protein, partial [Bryobacterales bacterium]|nr:NPCBM/NEW2 domain-containing protein [Bryobacterales bacterium]
DRSNGEQAAGDGNPLRMKGLTYAKGLGVHAPSDVRFALGGRCNTFQADVGIDQEAGTEGSVVFEVWVDGMLVRKAGILRGSGLTDALKVDITNRNELRLVVTDAGDGRGVDHADWANARVTCQP